MGLKKKIIFIYKIFILRNNVKRREQIIAFSNLMVFTHIFQTQLNVVGDAIYHMVKGIFEGWKLDLSLNKAFIVIILKVEAHKRL